MPEPPAHYDNRRRRSLGGDAAASFRQGGANRPDRGGGKIHPTSPCGKPAGRYSYWFSPTGYALNLYRFATRRLGQSASVAQLAEQLICNQQVVGSSPSAGLPRAEPAGRGRAEVEAGW